MAVVVERRSRPLRKSEYVLGRKQALERFNTFGEVVVSVVQCLPRTDPWRMCVETVNLGRRKYPILYRIRVKRKSLGGSTSDAGTC